jgi:hypothetical protein
MESAIVIAAEEQYAGLVGCVFQAKVLLLVPNWTITLSTVVYVSMHVSQAKYVTTVSAGNSRRVYRALGGK